MNVLEGIANSFSTEERKEAAELELRKNELIQTILAEKKSLDSNFVRLSQLVNEVRAKKYWLLGPYKTFGDYLAECESKFGVGKSQLYVGMKVARNLLPSVDEQVLIDMGITKAGVLSKYVEQSGQTIPEDLLQKAKDPEVTSEELDSIVNSALHNVPQEQGVWMNLGGFFASEDEKQEIQDALNLAASIDPVVQNNIPMWQQTREKYLRLAREFLSTYSQGDL